MPEQQQTDSEGYLLDDEGERVLLMGRPVRLVPSTKKPGELGTPENPYVFLPWPERKPPASL